MQQLYWIHLWPVSSRRGEQNVMSHPNLIPLLMPFLQKLWFVGVLIDPREQHCLQIVLHLVVTFSTANMLCHFYFIIVIVFREWGPVICIGKVSTIIVYFTRWMQLCCYWQPHTLSSAFCRFPSCRPLVGIGLQFPAMVVGTIGMHLASMRTSCCGLTFLFPTVQFFGGRCRWILSGWCWRGGCCRWCFALEESRGEFCHHFVVCLDECLNLFWMLLR